MKTVRVELGDRSYPIYVGEGLLARVGELTRQHLPGRRLMVISNSTVTGLYGEVLKESLEAAGWKVLWAEMPDGEEHKNLATVSRLYDLAVEGELERGDAILAFGGGVVGDVAGFVAATFMRGVAWGQVPTTLLAQVDASVGGKVGVNHPQGKNLIGAFHQPRLVVADVDTLRSLPRREIASGMAEVVKYGVIRSASFFAWLEENVEALLSLAPEALTHAVATSCRIKAEVVAADEKESGLRAILNFGHTVGHALEAMTDYVRFAHGEAVAIGMVVASRLARRLGLGFTAEEERRLANLLEAIGLPTSLPPGTDPRELLLFMQRDKKVKEGKLTFILPRHIGEVEIVREVPQEILLEVLGA
ncbi:3-dehydroquinate synthase [Ammonifex degensii KC4]|uniref:3-dehydroquinate synthase n=1 Tax=Ammonifex degensii (strain DSM 10501 / KC4) TaxID=429009 RepID=C9RC29_AMMDK|nr:3-dehydroquinate synthase [Ammonifex degensii]ACX51806.1 3-dehydroquinate synthase [Ammonifex degensii KC4]